MAKQNGHLNGTDCCLSAAGVADFLAAAALFLLTLNSSLIVSFVVSLTGGDDELEFCEDEAEEGEKSGFMKYLLLLFSF
jgi:hypothetical protein